MLECVLYIFLGGTTMLGGECIPHQGVYYPDRVEYVNQYAPKGYVRYDQHQTYFPYNYWYSYNRSYYYYYPRRPHRYRSYRPPRSKSFRSRYKPQVTYKRKPTTKRAPPRHKQHKKGKKKWRKK